MVNGASAALLISDIPWGGPIGCVRVAEVEGNFIVNPSHEQQFQSSLDLIYVGNENEMMMIEGSADQISEERFLEAIKFAHENVKKIIDAQKKLHASAGKTKKEFDLHTCSPELLAFIQDFIGDRLTDAVFNDHKQNRDDAVKKIMKETILKLQESEDGENFNLNQVGIAFETLQENVYRENILKKGKRADGRNLQEVRNIECQAGILPRVHGSALFQRGETQNIVIATLGTSGDAQDMDGLTGGSSSKSFILHYNFPPYSVGETGRFSGPGRREIGHGALAERSLLPVIPSEDDFPYTVRLTSDIMESNGSSSMASVCGGCIALMDAGVPITDVVGGISVGLVTETDDSDKITNHVVLTDILGSEDHFGDMDFKICGTEKGITGFQLDLKIKGLPFEIAKEAVSLNRKALLDILKIMSEELAEPRPDLNEHAPRIHQLQIDPEKIGALIGPGGRNIRRITEVSGAGIDINEDNSGKILVYSNNKLSMERAIEEIELSTAEIEVDKIYRGTVRGIKEFGVFVECLPGKEGLVHISELADFRVEKPEDICKMGDEMWVKCIETDDKGRIRLSRRIAMAEREGRTVEERPRRSSDQRSSQGGSRQGSRERRHGRENRDHRPRDRDTTV
jgi:polyribonucleotide nucleotidyltransferase